MLVMAGVVCLLVWAGMHNLRTRRAVMQQAQQKEMTVEKEGGAPQGAHLIGKPAPAFTMVDTEGKKVSLADFKGRPVVVNFWATWCGPCKLEMPWFEEFRAKYKADGVEVLGISEDDGAPKDDIAKAVKKAGVTYPILLYDATVSKAYGGVEYLPETYYIDKNGVVVEETHGAPSKDEMEANFRRMIGTSR